jgi:hypothetical protein
LKVPGAIDPALVRDYVEAHPAAPRIEQQQR